VTAAAFGPYTWVPATGGERRYAPTARRLRRARERGQIWRSPDFTGGLAVMAAVLLLRAYLPWAGRQLGAVMAALFQGFASPERLLNLSALVTAGFARAGLVLLPVLAAVLVVALLASFFTTGFSFTTAGLQLQWQRLNPVQGLQRMFSWRGVWELLKGLLKVLVVGALALSAVWQQFRVYPELAALPLGQSLTMAGSMVFQVLLRAAAGYLLVGVADMVFQYVQYQQSLRMTEQEMREETRETEGDPQIRRRRRQLQRRLLRQGLTQVRRASVVVTNPTHIAVALRYAPAENPAPVVVAKGEDDAALEIRRLAVRHEVPVMSNPPLAHQLYEVPLGESIPERLYRAVAEVLAYVMRRAPRRERYL